MIEFRNVTFQYHYTDQPLFEDLSFCLQNGVNTVLCDLQSGKTSIAKLLMGQVNPNAGQIFWNGQLLQNVALQNRGILYLPSKPTFFTKKSVAYNVSYPLTVRKEKKQQIAQIVNNVANKLGLQNILDVSVGKLDVRQQLTVALARGLTVARNVVIFDGFLEQLGEQQAQQAQALTKDVPTTVILTDNVAFAQGHTVVLDGGKCAFQGSADSAKSVIDGLYWLANKTRRI